MRPSRLNHPQLSSHKRPLAFGRAAFLVSTLATSIFASHAASVLAADEPEVETLADRVRVSTPFYQMDVARTRAALLELRVDGIGRGELGPNALRSPRGELPGRVLTIRGTTLEYRKDTGDPAWSFSFGKRTIELRSSWSEDNPPEPLELDFDPAVSHVTLLGRLAEDGSVRLPALLHFPGMGSFRIRAPDAGELKLAYASKRFGDDFVRVTLPAATAQRPRLLYELEATAIYPEIPGIAGDRRFDGFRRGWLNILQINPQLRVLANHAASDPCAFTLYEYSEIARRTPQLADGLTALDILRETLDRYVGGMKAYGISGYAIDVGPHDFLDSHPSLLISAWNYWRGSGDDEWIARAYPALTDWAAKSLDRDLNGNGLVEYPLSGNSGSWPEQIAERPANWWDTIGFGHEDAYSNILVYRALRGIAEMARSTGHPKDAAGYEAAAKKLRDSYMKTFLNPATGVLAGWKSADGELHDYWFTFVNAMAIDYGIVPEDSAHDIMDRLLAKMRDVGYDQFQYGLPGNLIPIRREDYVHLQKRWGGSEKEDGSDGFQIYENGGATACHAYYTLAALYGLGRTAKADRILFPMLDSFAARDFQGAGPNGMTRDWKAWDGTPHGYEGFLVDGYLTFLAVLDRAEALRRAETKSGVIGARIEISPDGKGFVAGGEPWAPFGANYFDPLTGWAPKPWQRFDERRVEEHFGAMAALGVNTARVFLTAASFIPEPPGLEEDALGKFDKMLAIAHRHGIRVHPTGPDHWEGTPSWRRTDFLADQAALDVQVAFWRQLARRYRGDSRIFAFDLLNEPHVPWSNAHLERLWPLWLRGSYESVEKLREAWRDPNAGFKDVKPPADEASPGSRRLLDYQRFRESVAERWTRLQVEAIHAEDPTRLVTVGLIQWSAPVLRQRPSQYSAFRPRKIADLVDFSSVHFYPLWGDPLASDELLERNLAYFELVLRICSSPKPLVLGEFGWYGGGAPRNHIARTPAEQARWNVALAQRSRGLVCGWLNWSWSDVPTSFDISKFSGLVTIDGEPKPWGEAFAALAPELSRARLDPTAGERGRVPFPFDEAIVDPAAGTRALERFAAGLRESP